MTIAQSELMIASMLFRNIPSGVLITNSGGTIIDVNPSCVRITGYTRDELIGQTPRILKSGKQSAKFYQRMWAELVQKGAWAGEVQNRRGNGEIYTQHLNIHAVRDDGGSVCYFVAIFDDVSQQRATDRKLATAASHDLLTQLPNRAKLREHIQSALDEAMRNGKTIAVCYIDLDGFKSINDKSGDKAGDALLQAVSNRLKVCIRTADVVARIGGDEFAVLLSNMESKRECKKAISRILASMSNPFRIEGVGEVKISASCGVAMLANEVCDPDALLRQAALAMYQAKGSGKNRYAIFDNSQEKVSEERSQAIGCISKAMDGNELLLFYQPKIDMNTGVIEGFEALVRWQHPERGLVPPGDFLPHIEGSAASIRLGYWVLEAAIEQLAKWQAAGIETKVSINIPGQVLLHENLVSKLKALLGKYPKVNGNQLQMEILESVALTNLDKANEVIKQCRQLGLSFALDDFGTGYSSLTYLKQLDVDVVKIDQSFVRYMIESSEDLFIVEGIVSLVQAFNRTVVAEGIETFDHGRILLRLGCDHGQGYSIAKPMPASDIPSWMEKWRLPSDWSNISRWGREHILLIEAEVAVRTWVKGLYEGDEKKVKVSRFADNFLSDEVARQYRKHPRYMELMHAYREMLRLGEEMMGEGANARSDFSNLISSRGDRLVDILHSMTGDSIECTGKGVA